MFQPGLIPFGAGKPAAVPASMAISSPRAATNLPLLQTKVDAAFAGADETISSKVCHHLMVTSPTADIMTSS